MTSGAIQKALAALERHWRLFVVAAAAAALLIRLAVIAVTGGGADLRIYVYFGRLAAAGQNPFDGPPDGEIPPDFANNPPLLMLLYAGLLQLRDSPDTLRVAFALVDVGVIAALGAWSTRTRPWRAGMILLYGFNPLVLYSWTAHAEDKMIWLLGLIGVLAALERASFAWAWTLTAALAAVKWIGAFWALPLALATLRERGLKAVAFAVVGFGVVFGLGHLPYLPESLEAYGWRAERTLIDPPIHASLLKPLSGVGLYAPWLVKAGSVLILAGAALAYLRGRLTAGQAVVVSMVGAYVFLPDESDNRVLLLVLALLLVVRMTPVRYVWTWALTTLAAVALVVQQGEVGFLPGPLSSAFDAVFGAYGSTRHVIVINAVLVLLAVCLLLDLRQRQRVASP